MIPETELRNLLMDGGAAAVGFCTLPSESLPPEAKPTLRYAVSIACKLTDAVLQTIQDRPSLIYFQHYRAVNARLDQLALDAAFFLERQGYSALPIAASQSRNTDKEQYCGVFPHKTAAVRAGLGWIGKNALLFHPVYGSKLRFATVLTDCPFPGGTPIPSACGNCHACVDACPAGAIRGTEFAVGMSREMLFDAEKCSRQMKTYQDVGRGAVCGICIRSCPKNKL